MTDQNLAATEAANPAADSEENEWAAAVAHVRGETEADPAPEAIPAPDEDPAEAEPEAAEPAADPVPAEDDDPFTQLPEPAKQKLAQMRAALDYAEQYRRSNAGRELAYQQRIRELEAQGEAKPKPQDVKANIEALATQLEDYDPNMGKVFRDSLVPLAAEMEAIKTAQSQVATQNAEQHAQLERERAMTLLQSRHPDLQTIAASTTFQTWVQSQPKAVQAIVRSDDPEEAAWMLDQYKRDVQITAEARAIRQADRQTKLQNAVGVGRSPAGQPAPNDDAEFAYFANKLRPQSRR